MQRTNANYSLSVSIAVKLIADLKQFCLIRKILNKKLLQKIHLWKYFTQLASVFICVNVETVSLMNL